MAEDTLQSIGSYLASEFALDAADIEEMLNEYFKNMDALLKQAVSNMDSADSAALKKTGHTIKGVASNVGSMNISGLGRMVEVEALAEDIEACRRLMASIESQVNAMKAARDAKA